MIRNIVLCWCLLAAFVQAKDESQEVIAYNLGKGATVESVNALFLRNSCDPFSDENVESTFALKRIKPSFQSRFLGEKDVLWDYTSVFRDLGLLGDEPASVIFNESTGHLIVRGNRKVHGRTRILGQALIVQIPRQIKMTLRFQEAGAVLSETTLIGRPGLKVVFETGQPKMKIEWEGNVGAGDIFIDARLSVSGEVMAKSGSHKVIFQTGLPALAGIPETIELGNLGSEGASLSLWVCQELITADGALLDDLILYETKTPTMIERRRQFLEPFTDVVVDEQSGKAFASYQVPPTFVSFLSGGEYGEKSAVPPYQGKDKRIKAGAADRLLDAAVLLKLQGVPFGEGDFAVLNGKTERLYVQLPPKELELVDAIINARFIDYPRYVIFSARLMEADQAFTVAELGRSDLRCLAKISGAGKPGQKCNFSMARKELSVVGKFEPNIGARDNIVDIRGSFSLNQGENVLYHWKAGMTSTSGEPIIVQQYRQGGKWRALVIETEIVCVEQKVFGESGR